MAGIGGDSAARPAGREHIPVYPAYLVGLRAAQLLVAIIVLGLDAYGLSIYSFSGDSLMMFTVIATIIVVIYNLVSLLGAPMLYNYWAVLGLDIFLVVFWLISFALLASQVAPWMGSETDCAFGYCYTFGLVGQSKTFANCLAAAAGLGGLAFLLFVITLAIHSLALTRHRSLGLHCMPGQAATPPAAVDSEKAAGVAPVAVPMQPAPSDAYPLQTFQQPQPDGTQPYAYVAPVQPQQQPDGTQPYAHAAPVQPQPQPQPPQPTA